jgi:hypothetical protein
VTVRTKILAAMFFGASLGCGIADSSANSLQIPNDGNPAALRRDASRQGLKMVAARPTTEATERRAAHVASATIKLDLSKLTMADFGDVDAGH